MRNRTIGLGLLVMLLALLVLPATAQVPGQTPLNPQKIPQFVDPLPHFAGLRVDAKAGGSLTVKAVPHQQVAVSTGTKLAGGTVGPTAPAVGLANLWVYTIFDGTDWTPPLWPAFTIEAERGNALNVTYINGLGTQTYGSVNLIVDPTLHSAEPLMMMPATFPQPGAPPITVHLHGGEVPPKSDGGPDSWYTPGYAATGHSFNPDPYYYPNTQEPATLWFHDHVLGATRLNVYAGMAGFYFLRGGTTENNLHLPGWSDDDLVMEAAGGFRGTTPYLPEIEIVIQDRMFDTNGQLYYPNLPPNPADHPFWTPEFVGDVITVNGKTWPYLSVAPRKYRFRLLNGSNARFYNLSFPKGGPTITQIGTDGGFLDQPVALGNGPLLIAPGERADVVIDFTPFAPVPTKKGAKVQSFILGNDARTPFPGGAVVRGNTTGRIMQFVVNGTMVDAADHNLPGTDKSANLLGLNLTSNVKLTDFAGAPVAGVPVVKTRQLTLNEVMGAGGPLEVLVNNTKWSGLSLGATVRTDFTAVPNGVGSDPLLDYTYYSETMVEGTTEIWQIINLTADSHPIHLHLVQFQLMSRTPFNVAGYTATYDAAFPGGAFLGAYGPPKPYDFYATGANPIYGGNPDVTPFLVTPARGANPNEKGWKDTFVMYPGEVTTVIARWTPTDKPATADPAISANEMWFPFDPSDGHGYVWHCHIIDHEDNEMMRPYNVIRNPALGKRSVDLPVAESLPSEFSLSQNYPNPFNPETTIEFALPKDAPVRLSLYNSLGQEMQTLINEVLPAGTHTVRVNAKNLASGVYYYKIAAGSYTAAKSMVLVR